MPLFLPSFGVSVVSGAGAASQRVIHGLSWRNECSQCVPSLNGGYNHVCGLVTTEQRNPQFDGGNFACRGANNFEQVFPLDSTQGKVCTWQTDVVLKICSVLELMNIYLIFSSQQMFLYRSSRGKSREHMQKLMLSRSLLVARIHAASSKAMTEPQTCRV